MSIRAVLVAAVVTGLLLGIVGTREGDSGHLRHTGSVTESGR
ncbi:hypothetical protein ABII15_03655 [Streptomyces sp. HUAS MG91]|uniref:Uncharacterized protein n=1 Tax=Streptomyces tabacisoli TaxID=3156398 RepID=A0AAU8ILN9_9ACTN